jgi:hypothetical protein
VEEPTITKSKNGTAGPEFNKSVLIVFFNVMGIVHREFLPTNTTVNSDFCCDVLRRLRKMYNEKPELWSNHNWHLHHGNTPAHTFLKTTELTTTWLSFPILPTLWI